MDEIPTLDEKTILKIADMCPRAMSTYFLCLRHADRFGEIELTKDYLVKQNGRSWTKVRNDLRSLMSLEVLEVYEEGNSMEVYMTGTNYEKWDNYDRYVL